MRTALRLLLLPLLGALALGLAPGALAAGGRYAFDGGTARERAQVTAALDASSFDWGLVPGTVTIHLRHGGPSHSLPGAIFLDADVLDAGMFGWAVVQDEYAHQVDFRLLDVSARDLLREALGAEAWWHGDVPGVAHARLGCERFASTLVWSYWQSPDNAYRPTSADDESAAMAPAAFRSLLARLVGAPDRGSRATQGRQRRR